MYLFKVNYSKQPFEVKENQDSKIQRMKIFEDEKENTKVEINLQISSEYLSLVNYSISWPGFEITPPLACLTRISG